MTFQQLRAFQEVARLGSVTAAAHVLGVTEPAVSASVGALKRELGDQLIIRGHRGVVLTPGGELLAHVADEILLLAESARRDLRAMH